MTKKQKNLFKGLGYIMSVASACAIISAAVLANHIETYYTPKFDAKQLAQDKALLNVSIRAREMERDAIYAECSTRVMNTPYVKELDRQLDSITDMFRLTEEELYDSYPGISMYGTLFAQDDLVNKMANAVENAINETPRIRELDNKIAEYNKQIAALQADSVECAEWNQMSKMDHIKQNWKIMRAEKNNDRLLAHAYNDAKSY